jgi:dTDP-4-dehydrorhamnose reductase
MRVMLFGASGQLGKSLTHALADAAIHCSALSRTECDFSTISHQELETLVDRHAPTIIINAAAWAAVDDAEKQRDETQKVNAQVPGWLAEIASKKNIRLIHFSTDYVFNGERGAPYREDAQTNPINYYGKTKLEGEQAIIKAGGAHIFRLQLLYQATGNSFFCRMLKLLGERESLKVVADQISSPTTVADVARAIIRLLPLIAESKFPTGIYHMAAQGHTSRHGFACAMREAMIARGMKCQTSTIEPIVSEEFPAPAPRPKDTRLNTEKLALAGIALPHWRMSLNTVMDEVA